MNIGKRGRVNSSSSSVAARRKGENIRLKEKKKSVDGGREKKGWAFRKRCQKKAVVGKAVQKT